MNVQQQRAAAKPCPLLWATGPSEWPAEPWLVPGLRVSEGPQRMTATLSGGLGTEGVFILGSVSAVWRPPCAPGHGIALLPTAMDHRATAQAALVPLVPLAWHGDPCKDTPPCPWHAIPTGSTVTVGQ